MTQNNRCCAECGIIQDSTQVHQVYEFGDEDGKLVYLCYECYTIHEEKGDWVS